MRPGGGGGGLWRCKDGFVTIGVWGPARWPRVVQMLGNPEWASSELFQDPVSRRQNADVLNMMYQEWAEEKTTEEVFRAAQERSLPCMPVNTIEQTFTSQLLTTREFFPTIDHKETGKIKYPGAPYKLSETPWKINRAAPLLGEHNKEVYCGILDYTKRDLMRMRQAGII